MRVRISAVVAMLVAGLLATASLLGAQTSSRSSEPESFSLRLNSGWLGVDLQDVTAAQAPQLKLGSDYGALVETVEPNSPAAQAGIEKGDVIVEFAGERVRSVAQLSRLVRETPAGRTVEISVRRNGEKKTLSATLRAANESLGALGHSYWTAVQPELNLRGFNWPFMLSGPRLGVSVTELTPQLATYFGVTQGKGLLVREVEAGSAAAKAGVQAGDCIVAAEGSAVGSVDDLRKVLGRQPVQPGKERDVTLTIVRHRQQQTVKVQLQSLPSFLDERSMAANRAEMDRLEAQMKALQPAAEAQAAAAKALASRIEAEHPALEQEAAGLSAQAAQAALQARDWLQEQRQSNRELQRLRRQLQELRDRANTI